VAPGARWACDGMVDCTAPYASMKVALARDERGRGDLEGELQRATDGEVEQRVPPDPAALLEAILEATGGDRALAEVASTEVRVTERRRTERPHWTDVDLLFEEPLLGAWDAVYRIPHGDGPFPAAIGLHGHGDSPAWMLERPGFDFVLMNLQTDFHSWNPESKRIAEETPPALVPWRDAIHDPATQPAFRVIHDPDVDDVSAEVERITARWASPP